MINIFFITQIIWGVLYLLYTFLYKNTTYFRLNRAFLLFSLVLGLLLPFLQVDLGYNNLTDQLNPFILDTILLDSQNNIVERMSMFSLSNIAIFLYLIGSILFILKLILGINKISKLRQSGSEDKSIHNLVLTNTTHPPFSFLNHIYINKKDKKTYNTEQWDALLMHENIHITENHSYDNLFIALLKIIFWWSPFPYLYQNALTYQHEFIADSKSIDRCPKGSYLKLLTVSIQKQNQINFVNYFHNQFKKRLIMLLKKDHNQPKKTIYLWILPISLFLFLTFSCNKNSESSQNIPVDNTEAEVHKVVDDMPRFKGCESEISKEIKKECAQKKMLEYIYKNVKYPAEARKNAIDGVAVISFNVKPSGKISDAKIVRNPGGGTGEEALRVVKSMPDWNPGKHNGETVTVSFKLPIKFKLQ